MNRMNTNFESVLEKKCRIMSRNYNIPVVVKGNRACTDGNTIYLPMVEELSEELYADLDGFSDHEVAHVKYTDFAELKKPNRVKNRFHMELFNAVEDSRIEALLPLEYQGTAVSLERLNRKFGAKMDETRADMPWPIRLIVCIREIYDGLTPRSDAQIEPILAEIRPDCEALRGCRDTGELLTATEKLIARINKVRESLYMSAPKDEEFAGGDLEGEAMQGESPIELDPERRSRESKQAKGAEQFDPATEKEEVGTESGEDASEGEKGEDASEGEKGSASEGAEQGEKGGDSAEGEKSEGENAEGMEANASAGGDRKAEGKTAQKDVWSDTETEAQMLKDGLGQPSEFDNHVYSSETYMEQRLEEELGGEDVHNERGMYYGKDEEIDSTSVSIPYSTEHDTVTDFTGKGDRAKYASMKRMIMSHVNPIKSHLERVLKVKEDAKLRGERERGQLNTRSLAQLCIDKNYRRPFKEYTKTDTSNVAVTLLIDCSGSMSGAKMETARQTALALGESLKSLNITFEALGFNTASSRELSNEVYSMERSTLKRFNRLYETLNLMVFKKFDSSDLTGIVHAHSGGANADGESVVWASKRLAERKEKRKILIVLSDGQPSYNGANHRVLAGDLKRVVSLLPKVGIEPIGIGIKTEDVKMFYPKYAVVNDISKLSTTVMGTVAKMLEEGLA